MQILAVVLEEVSKPAGLILLLAGLGALLYVAKQTFKLDRVPRQRMYVVMILTFFSLLFWSFFEQAGSSINNFTDRNVDRVNTERVVTPDMVGQTIQIQPTQKQLGYHNGELIFTMDQLDELRKQNPAKPDFTVDWTIAPDDVGMGLAERIDETPASTYQAVNPAYIIVFGLIFTALWGFLANRRREPSTPFKFALGLLQLGLGFGALWWGAQHADARGMVGLEWLFLAYLLHTTGELCLSPVGLSMVTRLSPVYLVSTVMGTWFLATAFSGVSGRHHLAVHRRRRQRGQRRDADSPGHGAYLRRRVRAGRDRGHGLRGRLLHAGAAAQAVDARGGTGVGTPQSRQSPPERSGSGRAASVTAPIFAAKVVPRAMSASVTKCISRSFSVR